MDASVNDVRHSMGYPSLSFVLMPVKWLPNDDCVPDFWSSFGARRSWAIAVAATEVKRRPKDYTSEPAANI
jgi:hypothetical protein